MSIARLLELFEQRDAAARVNSRSPAVARLAELIATELIADTAETAREHVLHYAMESGD